MSPERRRRWRRAALVVGLLGLLSFGQGLWIEAKAVVAQVLLERAWQRMRAGEAQARPWPWADTWPVARLEVPRLGVRRIVLAGATGAVLAFAPGHLEGTGALGGEGNSVVSGHRDTHFEFLRRLRPGDELAIETPDGARRLYAVESAKVVREDCRGPRPELRAGAHSSHLLPIRRVGARRPPALRGAGDAGPRAGRDPVRERG